MLIGRTREGYKNRSINFIVNWFLPAISISTTSWRSSMNVD